MVEVTCPELTANAPENGWLEYDRFLLGPGLFSGAMPAPAPGVYSSYSFSMKQTSILAHWLV